MSVVMHGDEDAEAGDGDADGEDGEGEAVFAPVREGGHEHSESKSSGPWWDGVELGLDGAVAVGGDDAGGEVSVAFVRVSELVLFV